MSSPPIIDKEILPATPAHEWANTTSSSLKSSGQEHNTTAPETVTPGPDIPGAFPHDSMTEETTSGAFDTGKWQIPNQTDVKNAVINAGEAAKQYLPDALTSYFPAPLTSQPHTADTDPTAKACDIPLPHESDQDLQSRTDSGDNTTGIDRKLLGQNTPKNETSVQDTTDPRRVDTSFLTPHTSGGSVSNADSTEAQDGSKTSIADTPGWSPYPAFQGEAMDSEADVDTMAPSKTPGVALANSQDSSSSDDEHPLKREDFEGVPGGDFKGIQPPIVNTTPRTHPLAGAGANWNGVPLEESYQRALDSHPDPYLNLGSQQPGDVVEEMGNRDHILKDQGASVMGKETSGSPRPGPPEVNVDSTTADAGHSPVTQNHQRDGSTASNAPTAETTLNNGSKIENTTSRASGSSKGHSTMAAGSPHKSSFMDKVKGEVKVISGKISHNDEKVEEGKRLLGKMV